MSHELPKHAEVYAKREYWEGRYGQKGGDFNHDDTTQHYDWCQSSYSEFVKLILDEGISPFDLILNVGCGDSRLSFDLLAKAMNICLFNVDYAESVISRMHREASNQDVQCWIPMDIRLLNIRSDSMDHVIDKGTMDALFSDGSSPWTPSLSVLNNVEVTVHEIWRVLREDGKWICMSFGQPHFRERYFGTMKWREKKVIPLGMYHVYVYTK